MELQKRKIKLVLSRPTGDVLVDAELDPPIGAADPEDRIYGVYVPNLVGYGLTIYVSDRGDDAGLPVARGEILLEHPKYGAVRQKFSEMTPADRVLSVIMGTGPVEIATIGSWELSEAGTVAVIPLDQYGAPECRLLIREVYFTELAYR